MARVKRHYLPGHVWHITHRCHKKEFLLKFARDRCQWLQWLFEAKKRYGIRRVAWPDPKAARRIFEAIRQLMSPPEPQKRANLKIANFLTVEDSPSRCSGTAGSFKQRKRKLVLSSKNTALLIAKRQREVEERNESTHRLLNCKTKRRPLVCGRFISAIFNI